MAGLDHFRISDEPDLAVRLAGAGPNFRSSEMRFVSTGHESPLSSYGWRQAKKNEKHLDMLSSVVVNYNSISKFVLADRRQRMAREQTRDELLEENEI